MTKLLYTFFVFTFIINFYKIDAIAGCLDGYVCSNYITLFNAQPKYQNGTKNLDYVNPAAPKSGVIKYSSTGTFDSLNPFILKGVSASGISYIYDTLMASTLDDIFARYPLIAESVMMAKDKKSIIFVINKKAVWHDGVPITADDVVYSYNILIEKGNPVYSAYYADVEKVEKLNDHMVKFTFKDIENRELPFTVSELTIVPKHYYEDGKHKFDETTLEPPLGSGAYEVSKVEPGKSITYKLRPDYWGRDLLVNKGRFNFDEIKYDYYRDDTVSVEALKAGAYDIRAENVARTWQTAYDIDAVKQGKLVKVEIPHDLPTGMQCFVMNLREDKFKDINVRKALELAFDYEWSNKTLFYNSYTRNRSYFSNSIYEATGLPGKEELEILKPFKSKLPEEVFKEEYNPPVSDGSGMDRNNLKKAIELFKQAGWNINSERKLTNDKGEVFSLEFLLDSSTFERVITPYIESLSRLGIEAKTRLVDPAQYIKRLDDFDFDVVVSTFPSSQVPGNELKSFWHSSSADVKGMNNLAGIKNEVVDALIDKIIRAQTEDVLVSTTKALDRVLQHNHYVIPHWNIKTFRLLYWDKFGKPEKNPPYGLGVDTWWEKTDKTEKVEKTAEKNK